jgi:hypothetical protein
MQEIVGRLIAAGMEAAEAAVLVAKAVIESLPAAQKNANADRQKRYRDRNAGVTNRNGVTRNETVTNRNETVTSDASIYISSNNKPEERKIDIPERNALRPDFEPSEEANKIARQKGLDVAEMLLIYRNHLKSTGQTSRDYDASFCNFLLKHRTFGDKPKGGEPQPSDRPSLADYERAAAMFLKDNSKWGNRMGPEPGMGGCRCPPEILIKHGIDPKTGLRMQRCG